MHVLLPTAKGEMKSNCFKLGRVQIKCHVLLSNINHIWLGWNKFKNICLEQPFQAFLVEACQQAFLKLFFSSDLILFVRQELSIVVWLPESETQSDLIFRNEIYLLRIPLIKIIKWNVSGVRILTIPPTDLKTIIKIIIIRNYSIFTLKLWRHL